MIHHLDDIDRLRPARNFFGCDGRNASVDQTSDQACVEAVCAWRRNYRNELFREHFTATAHLGVERRALAMLATAGCNGASAIDRGDITPRLRMLSSDIGAPSRRPPPRAAQARRWPWPTISARPAMALADNQRKTRTELVTHPR